MKIAGHDIAVCSWSLQPKGMADLVAKVKELGLGHVQLALVDLVLLDDAKRAEELAILRGSGIAITSGMLNFPGEDYSSIAIIRDTGGYMPDQHWERRRDLTLKAGRLARELGLSAAMVHVGFVPSSASAGYEKAVSRIRELAAAYADLGLEILMETGQERASELLQFLNDLAVRNVHVNFDPANMILYGAGDPIDAIETLGRHIRHVHVKDATLSSQPGILWGEEVPFGTGQVPHGEFLDALHRTGYTGPLAIEREAGTQRMDDVRTAIATLQRVAQEEGRA